MRQELLKYINCPICLKGDFELLKREAEGQTAVEGKIICGNCQSDFLISKSILYLYKKLNPAAEEEKKSNEREMREHRDLLNFRDENWLLNFPKVEKMGINERSERIVRRISENTELSLKKYLGARGAKILEIGAGDCWVTAKLAENNYCVALDILTKPTFGLETGEVFIKNREIHFERVAADMAKLPFKDNIFDYVLISSSLHHSHEPKQTLKEIRRILKTGGRLVLLNEPSSGLFGGGERQKIQIEIANHINEKRYTIKQWRGYFLSSGFKTKIFLPENMREIFRSRGGAYRYIDILLGIYFFRKFMERFLPRFILIIFDGNFNAILIKE